MSAARSVWLPDGQRVLSAAERKVLAYLGANDGRTWIEVRASGGVGFLGWVVEAPAVRASAFLALLARDLIEPRLGYGPPPDVRARSADDLPAEGGAGNVVRLRSPAPQLAEWFFRVSQMLSTDSVLSEPRGFAVVFVGDGVVEVLQSGLGEVDRAHAASALLRHVKPALPALVAAHYRISERGRAMLWVSDLEDEIVAADRFPEEAVRKRAALLGALPAADAGRLRQAGHEA